MGSRPCAMVMQGLRTLGCLSVAFVDPGPEYEAEAELAQYRMNALMTNLRDLEKIVRQRPIGILVQTVNGRLALLLKPRLAALIQSQNQGAEEYKHQLRKVM